MDIENLKSEVRDMRDGDWYWISRTIFEDYASKIGVIGLALYNAYSSYARDKGVAFPSQRTISEKLGISVKTIIKYNRILAEAGLIKIEKVKGRRNLITLLKTGDVKEGKAPSVVGSVEDLNEVQTKENNIKENTIEVDDKTSSVKEIFSYFREKVRETRGFDPEINWAKDGRMIKLRLKKYGPDQMKELIDWYLTSSFSERLGVSLATCLSTYVINLYKSEMASQPLYPLWKPPKT